MALFCFLFSAAVVLLNLDCSSCTKFDSVYNISEEIYNGKCFKKFQKFEYTSKNGKKVYVYDGIIPFSLLLATRSFFSVSDDWRYVLFDEFASDPSIKFDYGNGIPWKSWQNPTLMSDTRFGHILKAIISSVAPNTTEEKRPKEYHMTEIYSGIIRRGDVTEVYRNGKDVPTDAYSAAIYVNPIWRKNSYGEILFYEDDDDFDIFSVVSPHCGRIVIWDSAIRYNMRPPSIAETTGQMVLFTQFHSNPTIVFQQRSYFDKFLYNMKESRRRNFVCTDNIKSVPKLDVAKYVFMERESKDGNKVFVFDNLFNKSDLDALRSYTIKYGKYFYDDNIDFTSDNVQWIAGFNVKKFVDSRLWPIVRQVATYVSGKNTWYPYDVACNLIRSADHTKFHLDVSEDKEEEMTFLLYLSPNWTADNYGETAFMEMNYDSPKNDYVAEVVPRYGRAVIFNGTFPHSARPPAPYYHGPRYTFAVKLSATKLIAVRKTFTEESRHDSTGMLETINSIIQNPSRFESTQKISAVHSFLSSKQIQQAIRQKPKSPENLEQSQNGVEIPGLESEIPLTRENARQVKKMMKFYRNNLRQQDEKEQKNSIIGYSSDLDDVLSADERVAKWKKLCKKDTDCLEKYLQLFAEQQFEITRRVIRDFLSFI